MKVYTIINKTAQCSTTTSTLYAAADAAGMPYRTFQDRLQRTNGYWENSQYIIASGDLLK